MLRSKTGKTIGQLPRSCNTSWRKGTRLDKQGESANGAKRIVQRYLKKLQVRQNSCAGTLPRMAVWFPGEVLYGVLLEIRLSAADASGKARNCLHINPCGAQAYGTAKNMICVSYRTGAYIIGPI